MSKGSDLLVTALENEGVDRIFGAPGEKNLDAVESLRRSEIKLALTRHEWAAALMAATHGRLTRRAGFPSTAGDGGAQFLDRRRICAAGRDADYAAHLTEGDPSRQNRRNSRLST